jgi:uncharacterized protein YjbJ (UPF0337 family)
MAINAQTIQGQWNMIRGQLKAKWGQLTDDDLQWSGGNVDMLIGRIQQKTGEGREAIERYLAELTSQGASAIASATEAVGQAAQQAADQLRTRYGQMASEYQVGIERAEHLVRQQPLQSIATAFGVGVVVGAIVGLALRAR